MLNENNLTVEQRLARQLCSYHIGLEGVFESDKPFKYIMASNGIYKVVENKVGTFVIKATSIPGIDTLVEGMSLNVAKIPYDMFKQTIEFFKAAMLMFNNSEAMVQFYYDNENSQYIMYCPEQEVSAGSVKFKRNAEYDNLYTLVLDIHSHNSMDAFFSGIDNADEKETRLFGVIGKLNTPTPAMKFRYSVSGEYKELNIFDIFEKPEEEIITFPQEWLTRCSKPAPVSTYRGATGGKNSGTYWWDKENNKTVYDDIYDDVYGDIYTGVETPPAGKYIDKGGKLIELERKTTKTNDIIMYACDVDIEIMPSEERIELIKDLIMLAPEDIAAAIVDEDCMGDLEKLVTRIEVRKEYGTNGIE